MTKIRLMNTRSSNSYWANKHKQQDTDTTKTMRNSTHWLDCCQLSTTTTATTDHGQSKRSVFPASFDGYDSGQRLDPDDNHMSKSFSKDNEVLVSDIIGGFGIYQLLVLIFSGLREGTVGYDAVVVSIITQPENDFVCADKGPITGQEIFSPGSDLMRHLDTSQSECYQHDSGILLKDIDGNPRLCESFLFENRTSQSSSSLITEWNLVCQREYLVALVECAYFIGLVLGNILWGYLADLIGRWRAYLIGHLLAICFGWAAVFATSVEMFILCRFLAALGSISYNIIYTIQVEIIGTEYRSYSTILNHLGWGSGVLLVPLAGHYLSDYRYIIAVAPCLAVIMLPWVWWIPESSRWLMANGYFSKAKDELLRGARFNNCHHDPMIENKIVMLNDKITFDRQRQELETNKKSYLLLFTSWPLVRDTIVLASCTFLSHLFYYSLTINFSYLGDISMDANFIISGLGEFIGCIIGALMMKFWPRRLCVFLFLSALGFSFLLQTLVDSHLFCCLNNRLVSTGINALGTISSLTSIFIILIINQEVYPTVIRQTGSSLVNTLGETGSAAAPFLVNLSKSLGLVGSSALFAMMSFAAAMSVYFLTETSGLELNDTVNQYINNKVVRRSSVFSRNSQTSIKLRGTIISMDHGFQSAPATTYNTLNRDNGYHYWPKTIKDRSTIDLNDSIKTRILKDNQAPKSYCSLD